LVTLLRLVTLGVWRDYLAVLVRLSYLSPEIVRPILAGQQHGHTA
jgi:hypothetical protein